MEAVQLAKLLEASISSDKEPRDAALAYLEEHAKNNWPQLLHALATVLADASQSVVARTAAGLQLKNNLTAKDDEMKNQCVVKWFKIEPELRQQIKNLILLTLGTEALGPSTAAQCVAYVAAAELPNQQWQDVIPQLAQNVSNPQSTAALKQATLECIGYICEEVDGRYLAMNTNEILSAIVQGMRKEEQNIHVKLAATKALLNALELTRVNFEKETERHYIMQVICEATQCENSEVKVAALQDLVKVASLYYQHLEPYMGPALFAITLDAMKSDDNNVALQGVEFWSTICDEEADLAIELADAEESGRPVEQVSRHYIKGALGYLVPVLLALLTKQEEFDEEEDWTPCKAAGVCLTLMAGTAEDGIISHFLPFIQQHIKSTEWKLRDAAVYAFGAMMDGPEPTSLVPIITQGLPTLLLLMSDETVQVRDTTAWVIGRICEHVPSAVLNEQTIIPLLNALVTGLGAEPRVASNVCWAISSLSEAAYENVEVPDDAPDDQPATYCLSPLYGALMSKVLEATQRTDGSQSNLRAAAYEALMSLLKYSPKDCHQVILETTQLLLTRLQQAIQLDSQVTSGSDRTQLSEVQSLLCAALQSCLRKLTKEEAQQLSDLIMNSLIQMLSTPAGQAGGVQEDALMTTSALVEVIGTDFVKYMQTFKAYLLAGLQNQQEYQVCHSAVGLVGDLSRAGGELILPYCTDIMTILLANLGNATLHRSVKPVIISTLGDIAIAIGSNFQPYLVTVCTLLQQASQYQVDKMNYDLVDYLNELRDSCLEAYTGILQGLRGPDAKKFNAEVQLLAPHVPFILAFINFVGNDDDHTDSNVAVAAGLLGDLFVTFGKPVVELLTSHQGITKLLNEGKQSRTQRTKTLSVWALKELKKLTY